MTIEKAVEAVLQSPAIAAASEAITIATTSAGQVGVVALPNTFGEIKDLEPYLPVRRRARGTMRTRSVEHFAAYCQRHAEAGAAAFVDTAAMAATAVLNMGTPDAPGHCDNLAELVPTRTAEYTALCAIADGRHKTQQQVAEYLEDWAPYVECLDAEGKPIDTRQAIGAVRKITIEELRRVETEQTNLSAARSAFERAQASSQGATLPSALAVTCLPYPELHERVFQVRLAVVTGEKTPMLTLRIAAAERHTEEIGKELAAAIALAFGGDDLPVMLGTFSAK